MKIEVGKVYKDRMGYYHHIINDSGTVFNTPFNDGNHAWDKNGSWWGDSSYSPLDLVEEVHKTFKIEVGKYYKRRDGEIVFIADTGDCPQYAFISADRLHSWDINGRYDLTYGEHHKDLIEEISNKPTTDIESAENYFITTLIDKTEINEIVWYKNAGNFRYECQYNDNKIYFLYMSNTISIIDIYDDIVYTIELNNNKSDVIKQLLSSIEKQLVKSKIDMLNNFFN